MGRKWRLRCCKGFRDDSSEYGNDVSFITTDAHIEHDVLQTALSQITNHTFNQITVDGDTSTNDMVIVMASGLSETSPINMEHTDWETFVCTLQKVCEDLAKNCARW